MNLQLLIFEVIEILQYYCFLVLGGDLSSCSLALIEQSFPVLNMVFK